jgi:hypothetical protein
VDALPNGDFLSNDPDTLRAFNEWAQDAAIQVYMGKEHHSDF